MLNTNLKLSEKQIKFILNRFNKENDSKNAHQTIWKRRSYAPMLIYEEELENIKNKIKEEFPDHTIVFDVIFESDGKKVEWHCDHESLGPFEIKNHYESLSKGHFLSYHFNLTENGGKLMCFDSLFMSYITETIIRWCGIFSFQHIFLTIFINFLAPWYAYFALTVFNNMALHCVTFGAPRISYVVRLVHSDFVFVTNSSIQNAISRSSNCEIFKYIETNNQVKTVREIDWKQCLSKNNVAHNKLCSISEN